MRLSTCCLLVCVGCVAPSVVAAQALNMDVVGVIPGPAEMVRASGSMVYVAAGQNLSIFDITDPAAPVRKGALTLPETIHALTVSGPLVYVANGLHGLAIVDPSRPESPAVVGTIKLPGEAVRVAVTGTKALVANRMSGVEVIDVTNPARPAQLGSHYTDGYTRDVAGAGAVAYIVDSSTDFALVDLSKTAPTEISRQESGTTSTIVAVTAPAGGTSATTAYIVGGGVLQVYDVSNPSAPKKVASPKIADQALAVAFQGPLGYMAVGSNGLQIVDVADPKNPRTVGFYKTAGPARDVAVAGPLVLVAVAGAKGSTATQTPPPGVYILRQR
jgi:hypothetical protein